LENLKRRPEGNGKRYTAQKTTKATLIRDRTREGPREGERDAPREKKGNA